VRRLNYLVGLEMRCVFARCLNLEKRLYNFSYGGLVFGAACGILGLMLVGLLTGFATSIIGFSIGKAISARMHRGLIQRKNYWSLPLGKAFICSKVPKSHKRNYH